MNWKRIVAGGLLAGLVCTLVEIALEPVTSGRMQQFLGRLGVALPSEATMAALVGLTFAFGIAAVWLYAAIEPRYGAKKSTAVIAGVAVWSLSCGFPNLMMLALGIFTPETFWWMTSYPLVQAVLGVMAGSWVYRRGVAPHPGLATSRA